MDAQFRFKVQSDQNLPNLQGFVLTEKLLQNKTPLERSKTGGREKTRTGRPMRRHFQLLSQPVAINKSHVRVLIPHCPSRKSGQLPSAKKRPTKCLKRSITFATGPNSFSSLLSTYYFLTIPFSAEALYNSRLERLWI